MYNFNLILETVLGGEVAGDKDVYRLSHAGVGRSGYSVGALQTDFGAQGGRRSHFVEFLESKNIFSESDMEIIADALKTRGNNKALPKELWDKLNREIEERAGLRALIDDFDLAQADILEKAVDSVHAVAQENPRYQQEDDFRHFVDSNLFGAIAADIQNQFGNVNELQSFVRGEKGLDHLSTDEKLNLSRMRQYRKTIDQKHIVRFDRMVENIFPKLEQKYNQAEKNRKILFGTWSGDAVRETVNGLQVLTNTNREKNGFSGDLRVLHENVKNLAAENGDEVAVRALQRGMDIERKFPVYSFRDDRRILHEYGVYGPKTDQMLRDLVQEYGVDQVRKFFRQGLVYDVFQDHRENGADVIRQKVQDLYRMTLSEDENLAPMEIRQFIWRSMDDAQVRPEHQDLDDQIFDWDDLPSGELPGQAFGCRCYAEPVISDLF